MDAFVTRLPRPQSQLRGQIRPDSLDLPNQERSSKRAKRQGSSESDSDQSHDSHNEASPREKFVSKTSAEDDDLYSGNPRPTDMESALPPAVDGKEAIEEYEAMKSSQVTAEEEDDDTTEKPKPLWIKGRSSIYVDAFNLALDTVLDEESHLFDEKENDVFKQWRGLGYEAQYLYVRLFLRKTAWWHRHNRLDYHSDVSNLEATIAILQSPRTLPPDSTPPTQSPVHGIELEESRLGETFTFADASKEHINSIEEAASLLSLEELKDLAKEAKIQGRNKSELTRSLVRMSKQQAGLMSVGLSRHNSRNSPSENQENKDVKVVARAKLRREDSNREQHFLTKILAILGPCIRLSPLAFKLFERVHLVFYRSTEWTEKSLTTIILAKIARRHFPEYIVCRTSTIFASRLHLLEYETAIRMETEVDNLEFSSPPGQEGLRMMIDIFDRVYPRWQTLVKEEQQKEQTVYEMGEGTYLRRFTPGHSYTRIVHKAAPIFGKLKEHLKEHSLLTELLDQRLFHPARRGGWYQRKALLEEHYMPSLDPNPKFIDPEQQKKHWKKVAVATCEAGLQDPDCHLIFHYDLQKRLVKLEKKLRIPRRLQHDFGHVNLEKPTEHTIEGIQIKKDIVAKPGRQASTKTIWFDELGSQEECSVEEMCLSQYRSEGWKGYHAEGGIIRTLFAYLFYDILFIYIPNVFQTAYQTCPLDLHTDAFYPSRASEINHRLVEIANGEAARLLREVWDREHEKRTSVVGLNWDFDIDDLVELVECFEGSALAAVCKVMAQEYRQRGGGIPDLILWRITDTPEQQTKEPGKAKGDVMFSEVKSANDRLSDTQRLWIHVLTGAGVKVALCNAVAKEVRED
ncbi:fanconi-associated nuclease 1 like protein [Fusarium sporotrichioides]|uniref:Fanconi-associated nuclease n=1 Tax=Fusarium sporotrichioides TaxID=5514 RepID=A0A395RPZ0_FUSSP|nr:fanconi-associated nuclease 1 like protein [Fusarium sporotrichioides]